MRRFCLHGLFLGLILAADICLARGAAAQDGSFTSVRLGALGAVAYSGTSMPADLQDSSKLFAMSSNTGLPGWLRWALSPQLDVGSSAVGAGLTPQPLGQTYRGLSWSVPLASGLLHQDDALSFGFTLGHGLSDLQASGDGRGVWPPTPYLRLGAGLSYQVTPRLGLYVLFDHVSGTGPMHVDESLNDLGMRIGLRF